MQQGQVFELKGPSVDGSVVWAYRHRTGGSGSRRLQRGGFGSERDAADALARALERLRRKKGLGSALTLEEFVDEYLAQHEAEPETIEKLRWLLAKSLLVFGGRPLSELRSQDRCLADDDRAGAPLRSDPGAAAGARARGRLGNDRRQPG
jgi:FMN phosphatase YigB (HAD superfamily)